jgi:hypothetical protein
MLWHSVLHFPGVLVVKHAQILPEIYLGRISYIPSSLKHFT